MASMTDYLENKLIDFLFRAQALGVTGASAGAGSGPTDFYIALFTAAPSDTGGGTEVSGNNYSRAHVVNALTAWDNTQAASSSAVSSGTGGTTRNQATITFPTPSATWGTVTHMAIFDASSGGNMLYWNALTASKVINSGDTVTFPANALTYQIDN